MKLQYSYRSHLETFGLAICLSSSVCATSDHLVSIFFYSRVEMECYYIVVWPQNCNNNFFPDNSLTFPISMTFPDTLEIPWHFQVF